MDFPIKNGGSFHSYVNCPEGKYTINSKLLVITRGVSPKVSHNWLKHLVSHWCVIICWYINLTNWWTKFNPSTNCSSTFHHPRISTGRGPSRWSSPIPVPGVARRAEHLKRHAAARWTLKEYRNKQNIYIYIYIYVYSECNIFSIHYSQHTWYIILYVSYHIIHIYIYSIIFRFMIWLGRIL